MKSLTVRIALALGLCASFTMTGCITITNIYPGAPAVAGAGTAPAAGNTAAAYPYPQYSPYPPPYYDPSYSNYYYSPHTYDYSWYYPGDNYYYYPGRQNQPYYQPPQQTNGGSVAADDRESRVRRDAPRQAADEPTAIDDRQSRVRRDPPATDAGKSADPLRADIHRDRPASIGSDTPFEHKADEKPKGESTTAGRNPIAGRQNQPKPKGESTTTDWNPTVGRIDESKKPEGTPVGREPGAATSDGRHDILTAHPDIVPTAQASSPRRERPVSTGTVGSEVEMRKRHDISDADPVDVMPSQRHDSAPQRAPKEPAAASAGSDARRTNAPTTATPVASATEKPAAADAAKPAPAAEMQAEPKKERSAGTSAVRRDAGAVGTGGGTSVATRSGSAGAIAPAPGGEGVVKND